MSASAIPADGLAVKREEDDLRIFTHLGAAEGKPIRRFDPPGETRAIVALVLALG